MEILENPGHISPTLISLFGILTMVTLTSFSPIFLIFRIWILEVVDSNFYDLSPEIPAWDKIQSGLNATFLLTDPTLDC